MADLLELSSRIIDDGITDVPVNRTTHEFSELTDNLGMVESFSHVVAWDSGDGLVLIDTSSTNNAPLVVDSLKSWRPSRVAAMVYTHGHIDHVGGSGIIAEALNGSSGAPRVIGHENVTRRFERYRYTNGYNTVINARQFGGLRDENTLGLVSNSQQLGPKTNSFLADSVLELTESLGEHTTMTIGDEPVEFHHGRGETDDHLWMWFPRKKWVATGDFVIWNFPNAGNPQKVQRWPAEWAATLRQIVAKEPELLLPAHGLPISGKARIATVLTTIADALETLVRDVVSMMNAGATLDEIIHSVSVPADTLAKPYMRPFYDEPEFVIHNIWRLYGGWWDGAPSRLKPSRDADLAREIAGLTGGPLALAQRALELSRDGDDRLASHLADFAGWAAPDDPDVHEIRQEIYTVRRKRESSLMSKGIFMSALRESQRIVERNK